MGATLHDRDFHAWAHEQASLLRAGKVDAADIAHIADEIESMGKSEKRELVSRLTALLLHLLKWRFQPSRRGASWEASIANARDDLTDLLADSPSLKAQRADAMESAYRRARREAAAETDMALTTFPEACPWLFDQVMDEAFWPR